MPSLLTKDHFELFSLPRRFPVERSDLDERYRSLQRTVHPDRYAGASDQERRLAVQTAAKINEAYETLKDPMQRGRYLLELAGVDIEAAQRGSQDPGFLMSQMEIREEMAGVRERPDPLSALDTLSRQVREQYLAIESQLAEGLERENLQLATDAVVKMQFFNRLQGEIGELEAELEGELF